MSILCKFKLYRWKSQSFQQRSFDQFSSASYS